MSTIDTRNETSTQRSETPTWSHLKLERRSPTYWRVTFDHPPINTITATTITELAELVDLIERDRELNVVVFDSANPDFFLAHYDTENDPGRTAALPAGPTGMHPWLDLTARLSRAPVVSIAAIRGRARGAGSEFVLACDLRFASRENTLIGQFEVGVGFVPGGGPMARLSRLAGRGRALEVLLVADDLDGPRAELYGYVNRAIADAALDDEIEAIASRIARFDHEAIARTKAHVDRPTLPPDERARRRAAGLLRSVRAARAAGAAGQARRARAQHRRRSRAQSRPARRRGHAGHHDLTHCNPPAQGARRMTVTTERPRVATENPTLVESSVSATINAPIEKVDIPAWCYSLPDSEYQACSPAHCRRRGDHGARRPAHVDQRRDHRRKHHRAALRRGDRRPRITCRLTSRSDLFTPSGRTKIDVIWDLSVRRIDDATCELTNTVHSSAPPEMQDFLARQGLAFDAFAAGRRPNSEAHNRQETPLFAKSIERHALAQE